jgi:uncharacterized protein (DUF58 family)
MQGRIELSSAGPDDLKDLLKKVRRLEIKARGLTDQLFAGQYHAAFKGRGMSFAEVRNYQYGDDVRFIDWNVTARFNEPFVKVFEEERELSVMLMLDVSASSAFGSHHRTLRELAAEIAAVIGFSAVQNNDKIGAIFYSSQVEKFIPPRKGRSHFLRILRDFLACNPTHSGTRTGLALEYIGRILRKKATVFCISDFIEPSFSDALKIASRKHDLLLMRITDPLLCQLPDAGLIRLRDPESGESFWLDSNKKSVRKQWYDTWQNHQKRLKLSSQRYGVDLAEFSSDADVTRPLNQLFKSRGVRR